MVNTRDDLRLLAEALKQFPSVKVGRSEGDFDDEGWWHLMFAIDAEHPEAWSTISALAAIFNTENKHANGYALFKPTAQCIEDGGPKDIPLSVWSVSHLDGDYAPHDAIAAIQRIENWRSNKHQMENQNVRL